MLSGGPLLTKAQVGLPSATIWSIKSFCPLNNSNVGKSHGEEGSQPSRLIAALLSTHNTITSACLATSTASAIRFLFSSMEANLICGADQASVSVIFTPSAYKIFICDPY